MTRTAGPKIGHYREDEVERRTFQTKREIVEHPSSRVIFFDCPFCLTEVKAYVWSLCGGGKRCNCGAYFGAGPAIHWKDENKRQRR